MTEYNLTAQKIKNEVLKYVQEHKKANLRSTNSFIREKYGLSKWQANRITRTLKNEKAIIDADIKGYIQLNFE